MSGMDKEVCLAPLPEQVERMTARSVEASKRELQTSHERAWGAGEDRSCRPGEDARSVLKTGLGVDRIGQVLC